MKTKGLPIWRGVRSPTCDRCSLGRDELTTRCVPSRTWPDDRPLPQSRKCLYIIGEAPAGQEDAVGKPFVGEAGGILNDWLTSCGLVGYCDVVLSNTVRCMLPPGTKPNATQIKACLGFTNQEIKKLRVLYRGSNDLIVLCVGGFAVQTAGFKSLKESFGKQGQRRSYGDVEVPVFSTYHPASTLNNRSPENMWAVMDHLELLCRFLRDEPIWSEESDDAKWRTVRWNPGIPEGFGLLAIDIETYGIIEGKVQTVFHPKRVWHADGVLTRNMIQTVAVATDKGDVGTYRWADLKHRLGLLNLLKYCRAHTIPLVLKNATFDLSWLRYADPKFRAVLDHRMRVEDLDAYNFLYSDVRPENSLKSMSVVHGLAHYETKNEDGSYKQYASDHDNELAQYNQKDSWLTLRNRDCLLAQIESMFPDSPKLSETTKRWYSDVIWLCTHMSETGIRMDTHGLEEIQKTFKARVAEGEQRALRDYQLKVSGKGSQDSVRELVGRAVTEAKLGNSPDLAFTDRGVIRVNSANCELCIAELPTVSKTRMALELLQSIKTDSKILSSYLRPLIGDPELGFQKLHKVPGKREDLRKALVDGIAYPTWRPVPSGGAGWGDTEGGTKQGRITCVNPALQTYPKLMKKYILPPDPNGFMLWFDLSQIELRVAAYLSNDPEMLEEYQLGVDRHWARAVEIFEDDGGVCSTHGNDRDRGCETCDLHRQLGKTINFLIIYLGSWRRFVQTVREDIGYRLDKWKACLVVQKARNRYRTFNRWQKSLIEQVTRDGYWHDPILGQGRRFTLSHKVNGKDLQSRIANLPIQNAAANIMLAAQIKVAQALAENPGLDLTRMGLNVYDAAAVGGPRRQAHAASTVVQEALADNWYVRALEDYHQRPFPLVTEFKMMYYRKDKPSETFEWTT